MDKEQPVESARWYVVQSKPRQAQRAEINLMRQGYVVYHPRILLERVRQGKRQAVEDSLFTNYLFIQLRRWIDDWSPLRSTFGVCRLVSFGNEPLPVSDVLIECIRQRLATAPVQPVFQPGQVLRVNAGVLNELDAIFDAYDGEDRARLLIQILGRPTEVVLPLSSLARSA
ncbi:transcription termination/antitermination NusG family protein [Thiocapsa marina]|uniref:Transcriptional acivator RfaH n=1 Tax=Thiocapsa marina 5811 TaxID=768671 RepID=F9UG76_9GAMM|nr:transcription termination/antitermination NusG family protein [Thiocapsa marina]EGV16802.1 transcriptional acivator RfaH [Thiocapsa marina 5811]